MGLLYSMTNLVNQYFYPSTSTITPDKIRLLAKRLTLGLEHDMNKMKSNNYES